MAREKPKQSVEDDVAEDDSLLLPRTRRQAKLQTLKQEDESSDEEPSPPPKAKAKPRGRKSMPVGSESPVADSTVTPDSTPAPAAPKRKGGNKRKFTHEYCLTCRHYGRACGGRRDGEEGCAVCRDPNREKGEKLRECLWANPEAGITTYQEARVAHKAAQLEARAKNKAKAQELKRLSSAAAAANRGPLGLTVSVASGPPPPVSRQLNVLPPPAGAAGRSASFPSLYDARQGNSNDTITTDTSQVAHHPSQTHLPGINGEPGPRIHRPQVIKLIIKDPSTDSTTVSPSQPPRPVPTSHLCHPSQQLPPPASRTLSFVPPPIPQGPPYYDHTIQAWRYPSQAGLYLPSPPSGIPSSAYPAYQSPYGPPPAFANSSPAISTITPPPNASLTVSKSSYNKPQPLDKSGTPCRKWSRTGSEVPTLSGHSFKMKGWKPGTADAGDNDSAVRDDISSSDLSSVIDVDDLREFGVAQGTSLNPPPVVEHPAFIAVDLADGSGVAIAKERLREEPEDRLQAQIDRMTQEAKTKLTAEANIRSKSPPKLKFKRTANGLIKVNSSPRTTASHKDAKVGGDGGNDSGSDDEGPLRRLPLEIRNKLSRTATTHIRISDTETITVRPEHFKGESLRARSESRSVLGWESAEPKSLVRLRGGTSDSSYEDAIEDQHGAGEGSEDVSVADGLDEDDSKDVSVADLDENERVDDEDVDMQDA
ncbi:hypothetical protein H2198_007705 [Neophaeococcomyces mojaviensis]|uniref:Uncharacterized protein n=1 Tax=Neophaeococcomyces mojaviensis TaxID=3383035 RepID=A0ACC2ZZY8_9EURO|nr:hypothetical protein H2198_007705 [Knufia sp. JES_112]